MSADLDMSAFDEQLRQYMAVTPKDLEDVVNTKLLYVARGAMAGTPVADRSDIESALGVVAYKTSVSKKSGSFKRRAAILGAGARVFALVNAARKKAGLPGAYGKDMAKAARGLLGARLRAVGSLKAGWINPIRILAARVKENFAAERLPRVKGRGSATPAEPGWNPVAEMTYEITERKGGSAGDQIDPRVEAALQAAFDAEARSMAEYVARKVQERLDQVS
jgi:hypothetical protein